VHNIDIISLATNVDFTSKDNNKKDANSQSIDNEKIKQNFNMLVDDKLNKKKSYYTYDDTQINKTDIDY
jgi:hypothetical protein